MGEHFPSVVQHVNIVDERFISFTKIRAQSRHRYPDDAIDYRMRGLYRRTDSTRKSRNLLSGTIAVNWWISFKRVDRRKEPVR